MKHCYFLKKQQRPPRFY